jgi:hypothetical protein
MQRYVSPSGEGNLNKSRLELRDSKLTLLPVRVSSVGAAAAACVLALSAAVAAPVSAAPVGSQNPTFS